MSPRFWSFRMFAALWGILLAPVLPAMAEVSDIAELVPPDALAYAGWSKLYEGDDPEVVQAKKIAQQLALLDSPDDQIPGFAIIVELATAAFQYPGVLILHDLGVRDGEPDVQLAIRFMAGDSSRKISDDFTRLVRDVSPESEIEELSVAAASLHAVQLGDSSIQAVWGVYQGGFLLTLGRAAAEKLIAFIDGKGPSLAADEELKNCRGKLGTPGTGSRLQGYLNLRDGMAKLRALAEGMDEPFPPMAERVLEALGANVMHAAYLDARESDAGGTTRAFLHVDGKFKGLLKLWDQKPLTHDDLRIVPQDAYWAKVGNFDLAKVWADGRDTVEEIDPNALPVVEGALAMVGGFLGFSLTDELLPAFGDTWAIFDAPDHGGILLTGATGVVEMRDADAVAGALARVVELLKPMLAEEDVRLSIRQTEIAGRTINTAVIGGVPCPVAPSWTFVDGWMVFGLFPQTVAVAARQVDSKTRGPSILERPAVKEALAGAAFPKEFRVFGYADAEYFARLLYPIGMLWSTAGTSMISGQGVEIDPGLYPVLAEALSDVHDAVLVQNADADGIHHAQVGSANAALVGVAAVALGISILLPSLSRARELAKRAVSAANLRGIGQGCYIYANDHDDKFPASLEALIDEGLEVRESLNSPRDEEGVVSYMYISGQSFSDDVRNVIAYERLMGDEGTNVLFLDGHVQWISVEAFKRDLLKTYQRLDREDEMPPELRP